MVRSTAALVVFLLWGLVAIAFANPIGKALIQTERDPELNPNLFEGDILGIEPGSELKNAVVDPKRLWPDSTIFYQLDAALSALEQSTLDEAIRQYETKTCLRFKLRTTETDYVSIQKTGGGCSSYVGRVGGAQRMSLDPSCYRNGEPGSVIHEFMHAFGFHHEQSRTDRDDYVIINYPNIQPGKEGNFNKYDTETIQNLGTSYDYGSVLHYSGYGFAIDPTIPTIIVPQGVSIGQRVGFSDNDVYKLNALYKCNN